MKSAPPLFNDHKIANRHSLTDFFLPKERNAVDSHVRHRSLFLFGSATGSICALTPGEFYFEQDPNTGLYYWNSEKNEEIYGDVYAELNLTQLKQWNTTNAYNTTSSRTITARACWCTIYTNRSLEFCSSEFLSCNARSTPVTCFTLSSTDTFVQSFWPVFLFWIIVVVYALYFTEAGKAARQYCRRKFLCRSLIRRLCGFDLDSSDRMVERTLDDMIEHNPSRVSNIYRERIYRQRRRMRYEQRREQRCWYKTWKQWQPLVANYACCRCCKPAVEQNSDSHNAASPIIDVAVPSPEARTVDNNSFSQLASPRRRLALKTKVYHEDALNSTVALNLNENSVTSASPTNVNASSVATTWTLSNVLAPFHRTTDNDNVGMEEMDDEVEHGIRCAICLIRLRDSIDIIGDIPCNHCMHKQCLKEWLARKNRCPLCQLPDIADQQQPGWMDPTPEHANEANPLQSEATNILDHGSVTSDQR